jgi:hypothetical protein
MREKLGWIWVLDWNSAIDLPYNKIWVEVLQSWVNAVKFTFVIITKNIS